MKLHPHINFAGRCKAAFDFYQQCLGGEIVGMVKWGETPMAKKIPEEWHAKLAHATLRIGEAELAGVDDLYHPDEKPSGFYVLLHVDNGRDAERVFGQLAQYGTVKMPLQKTFWAARFGVVVDQFGVGWEINCAQEGAQ